MKSFLIVLLLLSMTYIISESKWNHQYSAETSAQLSQAIKTKILDNLNFFTNKTFAGILKSDLNQADDSKRSLKQIDQASASQLFKLFNIKDHCSYTNGFLSGQSLQCLNNIWKNYVPAN